MGKVANDVTSRLTDTSKYTGAHKERFGEDGQGKGLAGRENLVNNSGSTSSTARNNDIDHSTVHKSSKPVVAKKSDAETFGVTPPKIFLYQYADKNHAGEKLILTKQKFPTWKQINEFMNQMQPTGKQKLLVDQSMKEIKTMEEITDGGKYMAITAFDKGKLDQAKIPAAFQS